MIPMPVDDPLELAWFELNDYGNGRRAAALSGGLLKWVDDKFWAAFDDQRWSEREGPFRARALAHLVAQHLNTESAALADLMGEDPERPDAQALAKRFGEWCTPERATERLKALRAWSIKSGNAAQTDAMLKQAKDMAEMRAWSEDFDVDPLVYNLANGTLKFVHGVPPKGAVVRDGLGVRVLGSGGGEPCWHALFREHHDPADQLMQIATWAFDPAATCPMWTERLELVQPDAEVRAIFPRMYGQTLTGLTDSEEFYVHKGRGGDGKTKTHEILAHGHGDYYRHSAVSTWLKAANQRGGAEHRRDLVSLAGDYRFILCDEPGPGSMWDGELLKQWTGGGMITASDAGAKAKEATVFKPSGKLFVEVNPTPRMPGDDKGFRRRFRLIQWLVDLNLIPGGFESPAALRERLWSESSGVLNWMIAGCLDWLGDRRVPVPERESEALDDFWATGNPLGEWLDEECDLTDRDAETGSTVLIQAFKAWMEKNEIDEDERKKWNATRFGTQLGQRQVVGKKDRKGNKVRRGIRLRREGLLGGSEGASSRGSATGSAQPTPDNSGDLHPLADDDDDVFGVPR